MSVINIKNTTFTMKDGGSNSLTLLVGTGTVTWTAHRVIEYVKDRGLLLSVRKGNDQPVDLKFSLIYQYLTAAAGEPVTPEDFLKQRNGAVSYVSSDGDACQPFAVSIVIAQSPGCSPTKTEVITISKFRYESIAADPKAGTLQVSGKANILLPTVARV